jgi:hypothetical protein
MAEQVRTRFESDVGHLDSPLPELLPSGVRVLSQGIPLQQPDERDETRTLLRRRATRLGMTRLKRTDHEHCAGSQSTK